MTVPYAAVLLDGGRRLLLGRQYGGYPCPPGGAIEHGETPRDAAVREVREEAGVIVAPGDLIEVRQVLHPGKHNQVTHHGWWYAARVWRGERSTSSPPSARAGTGTPTTTCPTEWTTTPPRPSLST